MLNSSVLWLSYENKTLTTRKQTSLFLSTSNKLLQYNFCSFPWKLKNRVEEVRFMRWRREWLRSWNAENHLNSWHFKGCGLENVYAVFYYLTHQYTYPYWQDVTCRFEVCLDPLFISHFAGWNGKEKNISRGITGAFMKTHISFPPLLRNALSRNTLVWDFESSAPLMQNYAGRLQHRESSEFYLQPRSALSCDRSLGQTVSVSFRVLLIVSVIQPVLSSQPSKL